jgi:hypothetical protein
MIEKRFDDENHNTLDITQCKSVFQQIVDDHRAYELSK